MIRWVASGATSSNSRTVMLPVNGTLPGPTPETSNRTLRPPWTTVAVTPAELLLAVTLTGPVGVFAAVTGMNTALVLSGIWTDVFDAWAVASGSRETDGTSRASSGSNP